MSEAKSAPRSAPTAPVERMSPSWRIDAEVAGQVEDEDRGLRAEKQDEDRAGRNERAQDGMAEQGGQALTDLRAHVAGSRDDQRLHAPDER